MSRPPAPTALSPTPGRGAAARRVPSVGPSAPTSRRPAWVAAPGLPLAQGAVARRAGQRRAKDWRKPAAAPTSCSRRGCQGRCRGPRLGDRPTRCLARRRPCPVARRTRCAPRDRQRPPRQPAVGAQQFGAAGRPVKAAGRVRVLSKNATTSGATCLCTRARSTPLGVIAQRQIGKLREDGADQPAALGYVGEVPDGRTTSLAVGICRARLVEFVSGSRISSNCAVSTTKGALIAFSESAAKPCPGPEPMM